MCVENGKWKTESNGGPLNKYVVSPGFYVELASNSTCPVFAVGHEEKETEFRENLERLLTKKLVMFE